jgi:uncharacterized protein YlzI (FlbEa/FlbD family)
MSYGLANAWRPPMATYAVFQSEDGERVAINPDHVVSIVEITPDHSTIYLRTGGAVTVNMALESVIGRLTGKRD